MKAKSLLPLMFLPILAFAQTYTYSTLVSFPATSVKSAVNPYAPIIDASGNLYGVSLYGGAYNGETVFKVTPAGALSVLYNFTVADPYPSGTLARDALGNLYGLTWGSFDGPGTIFKLTPAKKKKILLSAYWEKSCPLTPFTPDGAGNLYWIDCYQPGDVHKLTSGGTNMTLYEFCSESNCTDGLYPGGALIRDRAGNLWGTTYAGGATDRGTVYKLTPAGVETVVCNFIGGTDGDSPSEKLTQDAAGNMYGVTPGGGRYAYGTVFKVTPTGVETVLHSFTAGSEGRPRSPVILDALGNLYGIADGGAKGYGIIYRVTPSGTATVLYEAGPAGLGGQDRWSDTGLAMDKSGNIYGTTWAGGSKRTGSVYKLTKH